MMHSPGSPEACTSRFETLHTARSQAARVQGAALHIFSLSVCDGASLVSCPPPWPLIGWAWSVWRVRPLTAADLLLPLNAWSVTL